MKPFVSMLAIGVACLVLAFLIRWYSEAWSSYPIPAAMTNSNVPVYTVDTDRQKDFEFIATVLAALGVGLTLLGAFRWTRPLQRA